MNTTTPTLPPALLLLALLSFLSLFLISSGTLWLLVALGLLTLASYVLRVRLPEPWLPSLLVGGILLGIAILSTPNDPPITSTLIGPARGTFLYGQALAILATLQFYRPTPKDPPRASLIALLCCGLILAAACNALEEKLLREIIPTAALVLGMALRAARQRGRTSRLLPLALGLALFGAVGIGWTGIQAVRANRERLTEWGNRFMNERPQNDLLGMSQQPILGPMFGARGSNARVLRIEGELTSQHLRGAAFETYTDSRWWPPLNGRSFQTIDANKLNLPSPERFVASRVTVTRLQGNNPLTYFPLETYNLEPGEVEGIEWATDSSGPVKINASAPYTYAYQEGPTGFQGLMALPPIQSENDRRRHLQLPEEIREALLPLAQAITRECKTPAEKVAAVEKYLLENYTYSLTFTGGFLAPGLAPGRRDSNEPASGLLSAKRTDMVLRFLLADPKRGAHCEFFASSAALLLRTIGVPTRYVTGYFAHEEEGPDRIIVRQRDAHAWCEAWVGGKGWVTVEATPPSGMPDQIKEGVEPWRKLWEWIEDRWQSLLLWLADREPLQLGMLLLGPFLVIIGVTLWQRYRSRPRPTDRSHLLPPPELAELARRFEAVFPTLEPSVPWSEQLTQLTEEAQPHARAFVTLYQRARFGKEEAVREPLEAALKALETAVKDIRKPGR